MAILYNPRFVALDLNGDPISGAQLWTYDSVATTTPKVTYSDAARTVEHANPVEADAYGVFPQIFGEEGSGYYCVLQDADDETIDEFLAVQMLGQDASSVFLRDFALNGRLKGYGEAGVVNLEFMPADGDDTGGAGRIGGAAGTQGETLEVDFADVTFTGNGEVQGNLEVTGTLQVGGVTEPFPRLLVTGTATAAATTDIALSSAFDSYELELRDLTTSVGATIQVRFSFDNGATYKDGTDYLYEGFYQGNASLSNIAVSTAASISLTAGGIETTAGGCNVIARFTSKSGQYTRVISNFANFIPGTVTGCVSGQMSGTTDDNTFGKATHVRVLTSTGTASFTYSLTGRP